MGQWFTLARVAAAAAGITAGPVPVIDRLDWFRVANVSGRTRIDNRTPRSATILHCKYGMGRNDAYSAEVEERTEKDVV